MTSIRTDALRQGNLSRTEQQNLQQSLQARSNDVDGQLNDIEMLLAKLENDIRGLNNKPNKSQTDGVRLDAMRAEQQALQGKKQHLQTVKEGLAAEQHAIKDGVVTAGESQGLQQLSKAIGASERTVSDMQKNAEVIKTIASKADPSLKTDIQRTLDQQRMGSTRAIAAQRSGEATGPLSPAPKRYTQGPSIEQVAAGAPLKIGQKGESVRWLQEQLNAAGANPPLAVDGMMGPKTEAALKAFQQSRGCSDTPGVFAASTSEAFDKETLVDPLQWKEMHADAIAEGRTSLGDNAQVNDDNMRRTENENFTARTGPVQNGVVPMSQGDYNIPIGNSGKTIRQVGCMMTAFSMASTAITGNKDMNPARANQLIKSRGGFVGASLVPATAAQALGMKMDGRIGTHNSRPTAMVNRLDQALNAGKPVVLGVDYRAGSGGTGNGTGVDHWICVTGRNADGTYNAIDSAGGKPMKLKVGPNGLLEGNNPSGSKHYVGKEMIFLSKA
jgi:peptidoglycan hydrolase-like protein with peptidoglycan-binding domain